MNIRPLVLVGSILGALGAVCTAGSTAAGGSGAPGRDVVFVSSGTVTIADSARPGEKRLSLPGWVADVSPSPDGVLLAYDASDAKGRSVFAVADQSTGRTRWSVTKPIPFEQPLWSPTGDKFVFSTVTQLWLGGANRRSLHLIAGADAFGGFAWRPDGGAVAFTTTNGLTTFNLRNKTRSVLVRGPATQPAWSADGTAIAFIDRGRLSILDPSAQTPPSVVARRVTSFQWSPDGRQLAYINDDRLVVATRFRATHARLIASGVVDFAWSPDSRLLTFSRKTPVHPSIFVANWTDGSVRRLTFPPSPNNDRAPMWSPDGKRIVFERIARGSPRVYVVGLERSEARPILGDDLESEVCGCAEMHWLGTTLKLTPPPRLVTFDPTHEIHTTSSVSGLAVDGERVAALLSYGVSEFLSGWESQLWSPLTDEQTRADVRCESNDNVTSDELGGPYLAGNRYAFLCEEDLGDTKLYVATDAQPQAGAPVVEEPYGAAISVAGGGTLLAVAVDGDLMRLDADGTLTPLHHYPNDIVALAVDQARVLVGVDQNTLQVVSADGNASPALPLPYGGGAVLHDQRLITVDHGTLSVHDLTGTELLERRVPAETSLLDATADLVLYTTATGRLHLLRLSDGHDAAIHVTDQVSPAAAQFTADGGIVTGYNTPDDQAGTIAYLAPEGIPSLLMR